MHMEWALHLLPMHVALHANRRPASCMHGPGRRMEGMQKCITSATQLSQIVCQALQRVYQHYKQEVHYESNAALSNCLPSIAMRA